MLGDSQGVRAVAVTAHKRPKRTARARPRKARTRDNEPVAWNEGEQRRALHAQLGKTMGEFLDLSSVPERGRTAIVAQTPHRPRQECRGGSSRIGAVAPCPTPCRSSSSRRRFKRT